MRNLYGVVLGPDPIELTEKVEEVAQNIQEAYVLTYDAYDGNSLSFENDDIDCVIAQVKILLKGNFRILKIVKKK